MTFHPDGRSGKRRLSVRPAAVGKKRRIHAARESRVVDGGGADAVAAVEGETMTVRSNPAAKLAHSTVRAASRRTSAAASRVTSTENSIAARRGGSLARRVGLMNRDHEPAREMTSRAEKAGGGRWVRTDSIAAEMMSTVSDRLRNVTNSRSGEALRRRAKVRTTITGLGSGAAAVVAVAGVAPELAAKRRPGAMSVANRAQAMPMTNPFPRATAAERRHDRNLLSEPRNPAVAAMSSLRPRARAARLPAAAGAGGAAGVGNLARERMPSERLGRASGENPPARAAARAAASGAANPAVPAAGAGETTSHRCRAGSTKMTKGSSSWALKRPFVKQRLAAARRKTTMC